MPRLVAGPPQHAAPSTYKLAPSEAFIPESVTATFDGSGAGGTFLPTLSIYSQDGKLIARSPATSVAAGSSAEVTFAPLLRAASAAATAGTFCSFAVVSASGSLAVGVAGATTHPDLSTFDTNDSATFAQDSTGSAGHSGGILITAAGRYFAWAEARFLDPAGGALEPQTSWMSCQQSSYNYNGSQSDWRAKADSAQGIPQVPGSASWAWQPWDTDQQDIGPAFVGPPYSEYHVELYNAGTQTMGYATALWVWRVGDASGL